MTKLIKGFSKLSKAEKTSWLAEQYFQDKAEGIRVLNQYQNDDLDLQRLHDEFIENTLSNFYVPYAVAPNFIINGETYAIPMAIEESSVVAAAALSAKFWAERGGFSAKVISTEKIGQIHFTYAGEKEALAGYFEDVKEEVLQSTESLTENMRKRGGGIKSVELVDKSKALDGYYQLHVRFETGDSMGANFINSCLETMARTFENDEIDIVMSILSNYVPDCVVRAEAKCKVEDFGTDDPVFYAERFVKAVQMAEVEPYRAVTHNKGIMNGIDAVVLATGNDFRAVAAGAHAYAARRGSYQSLTGAKIEEGEFHFWIEIPLSLGTVGGLTKLHPLAKLSLEILGFPSAQNLMMIAAVAGLAQNFAAVRALTTTGIQKGHMKMHLMNLLNQLEATVHEKTLIEKHFEGKTVTHSAVAAALHELRTGQ